MTRAAAPTLQEEIDRKTMESVESIVERMNLRMITAAEAYLAIETLYDSVSGLISRDITDTLWEVLTRLDKDYQSRYLHFLVVKDNKVVEVRWDLESQTVTVRSGLTEKGWQNSKAKGFTVEEYSKPGLAAYNYYMDVFQKLLKSGYKSPDY